MEIKSPELEKAEIYKHIFSGKAFLNPMTSYIISLRHSITLLFQRTDNSTLKSSIKALVNTLENFKQHTDDISGINLNSSHKIYDILDLIEKYNKKCKPYYNQYKACLGSILDSDSLKEHFSEISHLICNCTDEALLDKEIDKINKEIITYIQSDNIAYENLKLDVLTTSISCSLSNVVYNTKANKILSKMNNPSFELAFSH